MSRARLTSWTQTTKGGWRPGGVGSGTGSTDARKAIDPAVVFRASNWAAYNLGFDETQVASFLSGISMKVWGSR